METLHSLDIGLLHALNGAAGRSAVLDALMTGCAQYAPFAFAALLTGLWLTWKRKWQRAALVAGVSALIALGIGQVIGMMFPRIRPYEASGIGPVRLLLPHSPDTSFPSDHATLALAITVALWTVNRRLGALSLMVSLWLCIARVYIGAHYPSDVVGGAILGAMVAWAVVWVSGQRTIRSGLDRLFALLHRFHLSAPPPSMSRAD
jgi:membrane-associated phospholipid phosphatase